MKTCIILAFALVLLVSLAKAAPQARDVCVINMDYGPCPNQYPYCRVLEGLWYCCVDEAEGTDPCPDVKPILGSDQHA